ncbi:MAG: GerMN domain-containing protein [Pseudobutyrivibrio sp.]|nr:GerMN domain-containing protein [Pseudobutyrivibrio sp.]
MVVKKAISLILICTMACSFLSCGKTKSQSNAKVYYRNTDKTGIVAVDCTFEKPNVKGKIEEALELLQKDTDSTEYIATIPTNVQIDDYKVEGGNVSLFFSGDYDSLDSYTEILVRSAIVKTLTQIKGVNSVSFFLDGAPIVDSSGETLGAMTADSFIFDFGEETESLIPKELTLYFVSSDGVSLVAEHRKVYYSRTLKLANVVINELKKGPTDSKDLSSPLPEGTELLNISPLENGVCNVYFNETIESCPSGFENVLIYSIVNSLIDNDTSIKQVQIFVNSETPTFLNVDADLSAPLDRNEDIIDDSYNNLDEHGLYQIEDDSDFEYEED